MQFRMKHWIVPAMLLASSSAFADSIVVASIERKDVKITNVRDGAIEFTVAGRTVEPVPLTRVSRVIVTDEPQLTAAELAYNEKRFDAAAEQYQQALKNAKKPWMKDYIPPRMLLAAKQGNMFGAAVTAYVALLPKDPTFAQEHRPSLAAEVTAQDLKAAATALVAASQDSSIAGASKQAVLSLLLDVYRAQNDFAGAARVGEQILKSGVLDATDPTAARMIADTRLSLARLALAQKKYDKVIAEVEAGRALFTEPYQQAIALYCLAQVKDRGLPAKPEPTVMQDLAIDYVRVASLAKKAPEQPYLAESLYRAGQLCERAGDVKGAVALLSEVAQIAGDSPLAKAAGRDLSRLQKPERK